MAIAFDSATAMTGNTSVTSKTFSHTCSGSDRILFVISAVQTARTITGITYNSVAMTYIDRKQTDYGNEVELWYLVAPATGTNNVVISVDSASNLTGGAISFTGASQTGQPDASSTSGNPTSGVSSYSPAVTSVADNCFAVVGMICASGATLTGGTNTSIGSQPEVTHAGSAFIYSTGGQTPAGTFTLNVTSSSQVMIGVMASFSPAGGGGSPTYRRLSLLGVGQ